MQQLVQHCSQTFLGLTGSDLKHIAENTNYLSTVLGLVLLSGCFKKPILLITPSELWAC